MRGDGQSGAADEGVAGEGGRQPGLREFVYGRVCDLFSRMDGDEVDGLYRFVITEVEGSLLAAVMEETAGNQGRAARILGINRGTLRKKLREHGLVPQTP